MDVCLLHSRWQRAAVLGLEHVVVKALLKGWIHLAQATTRTCINNPVRHVA